MTKAVGTTLLVAAVAAAAFFVLRTPELPGPSAAQMAIVAHTDYSKPIRPVGPVTLSPEAQAFFNDSAAVLRTGRKGVQPEAGDLPRLSIADLHGGYPAKQ